MLEFKTKFLLWQTVACLKTWQYKSTQCVCQRVDTLPSKILRDLTFTSWYSLSPIHVNADNLSARATFQVSNLFLLHFTWHSLRSFIAFSFFIIRKEKNINLSSDCKISIHSCFLLRRPNNVSNDFYWVFLFSHFRLLRQFVIKFHFHRRRTLRLKQKGSFVIY